MQNTFPNAVRNHMNIGYDLLHRGIEDNLSMYMISLKASNHYNAEMHV